LKPRYPVYVPSRGRHDNPLTSRFLAEDGVPHLVVVEPREAEAYADAVGEERVLVLPHDDFGQGSSVPARNFILIRSDLEQRWRGTYNEDTDLCLQVLATGDLCTVLVNAFMVHKVRTGIIKGGNDRIYQGDGRLRMARSLERAWPGIARTERRYGRPQHVVDWTRFKTPLRRRSDVDWSALEAGGPNEYGMKVRAIKEVRSASLRAAVFGDDQG
jgi:hypothetical protein